MCCAVVTPSCCCAWRLFPSCVLQAGAEFVSAADAYVRRFIDRGIPSLFSDLKPLYADTTKAAALQELFEGYAAALRTTGSMPPLHPAASSSSSDSNNNRPPSSSSSSSNGPAAVNGTSSSNGAGSSSGEDNFLTWVLHYLSQHYDGLGQTAKALQVRVVDNLIVYSLVLCVDTHTHQGLPAVC